MEEQEFKVSPAEVLAEIHAIAMAKATDLLVVQDGQLEIRSTEALTQSQRAAICSIEKSSGSLKVKFYDKLKALELLGKHLGLFEQRAVPEEGENDLLGAILQSTKEAICTHDLPEIQQAAAACHDLVEPPVPS